jgi:Protein of unknown function (DUF433)
MHERIEMNSEVVGGKSVIRGTRVPVAAQACSAMTPEEIIADHPRVTAGDIRAAGFRRGIPGWQVARLRLKGDGTKLNRGRHCETRRAEAIHGGVRT